MGRCGNAQTAEIRLYDNLFSVEDPDTADQEIINHLNPDSLEVLPDCKIEASLQGCRPPEAFQFLRLGYFCPDNVDSRPDALVFNRSVSLKDSWRPK